MDRRFGLRFAIAALAIALIAGIGYYSYNMGVAQGIAESGRVATAPGAAGSPVVVYWPRPWGFGFFPFFPIFPLLFLFLFFFLLRGLFWRGAWGRGCWGPGYHRYRDGVPPAFEEWHRRAHAEQPPKA
jgi:hypothetical protein